MQTILKNTSIFYAITTNYLFLFDKTFIKIACDPCIWVQKFLCQESYGSQSTAHADEGKRHSFKSYQIFPTKNRIRAICLRLFTIIAIRFA